MSEIQLSQIQMDSLEDVEQGLLKKGTFSHEDSDSDSKSIISYKDDEDENEQILKQSKKAFLNRTHERQYLVFPKTTRNRFIIKSDKLAYGFQQSSYDPIILQNHIQKEQFQKIVQQMNKIIQITYKDSKRDEIAEDNVKLKQIIYATLLEMLVLFILCIEVNLKQIDAYETEIICIVFLSLTIFIVMGLFIKVVNVPPSYVKFEDSCFQQLDTYVINVNKQIEANSLNKILPMECSFEWPQLEYYKKRFFWCELKLRD